MPESLDQRLKNIEDKINELVFALESNEIRMKIPISPIQFKEEEKEEEEEEQPTQNQVPSVEEEEDDEEETPENPDEVHDVEEDD